MNYKQRRLINQRKQLHEKAAKMHKTAVPPETVKPKSDRNKKRWDAIIQRIPFEKPTIGAEVGVWRGDTCEKVLAQRPKCMLYLVDRWAPPVEGDSYDKSGAKIAKHNQDIHTQAYKLVVHRVKSFMDRVEFLIGNTVDMAPKIEDRSLDFVFIDADHSYIGVRNDLLAYFSKVKVGGWIGGHDWNKKWEVDKALLELFSMNRITLDADSTWFMTVTEDDHDFIKSIVGPEMKEVEPKVEEDV